MLRVRPTLFTADTARTASLFRTLGLLPAETTGGDTVFDAGGGRIELRGGEEGLVLIGFEAGDLAEFARRTRESGTAADVVRPPVGDTAVRVTGPGLAFSVYQGERTGRSGVDPALTVVCVWHTPDPTSAVKVLGDMGARPIPDTRDDPQVFVAKNGGLVSVRRGERQSFALGFEYADSLTDLADRLRGAGFPAALAGAGMDRFLQVPLPPGQPLIIAGRDQPN